MEERCPPYKSKTPNTNPSPIGTFTESATKASILQLEDDVRVVILEKELNRARRIMPMEISGMLHVTPIEELNSITCESSSINKSTKYAGLFERSTIAILDRLARESNDGQKQLRNF